MPFTSIRLSLLLLGITSILTGCPCSTVATLNISRMPQDKNGQPTVLVCPREDISFVWTTKNASDASIDNGIGPVRPIEGGNKPGVAPDIATTYQLTAPGEQCNAVAPATVHTIRDGEEYAINMKGEKNSFVWSGRVDIFFASPSIEVTDLRLAEETANSWPRWNIQRDDVPGVSGVSASAVVVAERTRVTPFPLVGSYTMTPDGSSSNAISTGNPVTVMATLKCRRQ